MLFRSLESRLHSRNLSPEAADSQQDERLDSAATDAAAHAKAATEMMTGAKTGEEKLAAVAKRTKADADLAKVGEARTKSVARNQAGRTVRQLGLGFFGLRPDRDLKRPADGRLAPGFLLPFEIVSIHLLVVLVGAAYLARAKRKVVPGSPTDL